jgi:hypothetical protein
VQLSKRSDLDVDEDPSIIGGTNSPSPKRKTTSTQFLINRGGRAFAEPYLMGENKNETKKKLHLDYFSRIG